MVNECFIVNRLAYDEYATIRHPLPYIFKAEKSKKQVLFFGTTHIFNTKNCILRQMEKFFDDFQPEILMIEGTRQVSDESYMKWLSLLPSSTIVGTYGEMAYIAVKAFQKKVVLYSPEPSLFDEINFIRSYKYEISDIISYYLIRYRYQWLNQEMKVDLDLYMSNAIRYLEYFGKLKLLSYSDYRLYILEHYNVDIEKLEKEMCECLIDPIDRSSYNLMEFTDLNWISRYSSIRRDVEVLMKVEEYLKTNSKVMVVFGASHVYLQKRPLIDSGYKCKEIVTDKTCMGE